MITSIPENNLTATLTSIALEGGSNGTIRMHCSVIAESENKISQSVDSDYYIMGTQLRSVKRLLKRAIRELHVHEAKRELAEATASMAAQEANANLTNSDLPELTDNIRAALLLLLFVAATVALVCRRLLKWS